MKLKTALIAALALAGTLYFAQSTLADGCAGDKAEKKAACEMKKDCADKKKEDCGEKKDCTEAQKKDCAEKKKDCGGKKAGECKVDTAQ